MAHDVWFTVPQRDLGKADVEFYVKRDGKVVGTLNVSKGSVVWFPSGTSYGHKLGWGDFDLLMKGNAPRVEKR